MITRRDFLAAGATAAVAAFAPGQLLAALREATPPAPALSSWSDIRAQFELSKDFLHFSSFFLASHPRPVREAIETYRKVLDASPFLEVERRMFSPPEENVQLAVRRDLAGYLGARPEDIALTGNTTTGLALIYAGLPLTSASDVLTTTHDHYVHHESIRFAAERAGARVRRVALHDDSARASVAEIVRRLKAAIRPETRAIGITWVHSSTGVRLPVREIAAAVAGVNRTRAEAERALLIVDGVHGLGAVDETIAEMGCDFFCAGTHKWMFAPRGTGIAWGRAEAWKKLRPTIPDFSSRESFEAWARGDTTPRPITAMEMSPGGFHAFEHEWAMGAAFRFHESIGRRRVAERIRSLNDRLKAGLAAISGVRLLTPRDASLSAGIVAFEVKGLETSAVVEKLLERRIVASGSPYLPSYPRLAPSLVNTTEEVDEAIRAVKSLARA